MFQKRFLERFLVFFFFLNFPIPYRVIFARVHVGFRPRFDLFPTTISRRTVIVYRYYTVQRYTRDVDSNTLYACVLRLVSFRVRRGTFIYVLQDEEINDVHRVGYYMRVPPGGRRGRTFAAALQNIMHAPDFRDPINILIETVISRVRRNSLQHFPFSCDYFSNRVIFAPFDCCCFVVCDGLLTLQEAYAPT